MNGHSDARRKSELMNYPRYRCAQFVQPNNYPMHPQQYYPNDVGRYGPVGTRILPDNDRFSGYPHYPPSSISPRGATLMDGRVDPFHNPSFHPHPIYTHRSPYISSDSMTEVCMWCC